MYQHNRSTKPTAMMESAHDDSDEVIIVLPQRLSSYVLRLLVGDLRRGARSSAGDMMEEIVALAMYISDNLPENLRTPVPAVRKEAKSSKTMMQAA